ncbi:hypothetical protein CONPUDRAFT_86981 [Coniophora puteana RWD-64-598 SS2]|uniref:Uncharacterized protein n=1 Tax=Coniophora puteana (strain RWD-64-598) TaxID=741705 RepID=A0A5M3N6I9_CONPW|nr:uncharacterized protein CONPUDRAFT_86981 [Coniophora puteana RWD-64-598 SS2]EIW87060.1 hypothetical protein CONPUDRAFT_86981 [Coniophora puteana RWD-64-598 SS2]
MLSSDVDFSPVTHAIPMHPVPISSNGGATLDWTGSLSDGERSDRRWTLSISKRKGKDRALLSPRSMLEKQEALFADRIARIKAEAQPHTLRKAAIISEQLERRYTTLGGPSATGKAVNLLSAARWYASLDEHVQKSLDEAEPLTWLKHLLDKPGRTRSQWHLSSLIVEEYARNEGHPSATTDHKSSEASALPPDSGSTTLSPPTSPYHFVQSAPASKQSFNDSLTRVRSHDDYLSFEPRVTPARSSEDIERRDWKDPRRTHRHSLPGMFESPHAFASAFAAASSPQQTSSSAKQGEFSPASSRLHVHDLLQRRHRKTYESDEGSSSLHSQSEGNSRRESTRSGRKKPKRSRPSASALQSPQESATEMMEDNESTSLLRRSALPKASQSDEAVPSTLDNTGYVEGKDVVPEKASPDKPAALFARRKRVRRLSLVMTERSSTEESRPQWDQEEEELLQHAYEEKSQMLADIKAQNQRMRQRLMRIASDIREFDNLRTELWKTFGFVHRSLSSTLFDTFGHDPSSVTGHTRRNRGWRAVEDTHTRIQRQRKTLDVFLSISREDGTPNIESVLDEPISSLMNILQTLEKDQTEIREKSLEVTPMLEQVKSVHAAVKSQYNSTLSHVSALYPELSHIIALEESYKDQYQQVWELGMDALTFLLDTVAPFWRNYGKVIGVDIQDFLIIPLYRNEFTGEAKRYKIKSLPKRSTRHWFALIFLFSLTVFVTLLQGRAAVFSAHHYDLTWIENAGLRWAIIPFFWIAIPIQWIAVIIEFFVVLTQLGVIAWWMLWTVNVVN